MRHVTLGVCLAVGMAVAIGHAQATDDGTFEVATLKQNKSGERGGGIRRLPGGRVTVTNMAARQLIVFAYQLGQYQLVGGPTWLADDKFDLTAKMEGNPEWGGPGTGRPDPIQLAMRKLLAERFKLKLHVESRDLDAYALVLAKPGVTGPQLKQSPTDCAALMKQAQQGQAPPPPGPPSFDKPMPCSIMGRIGTIMFDGFPMSQAAGMLGGQAGRPVVDRTGLAGNWQFIMSFAQERRLGPEGPGEALPAPDPNLPNFFTALQEQLGLKLEPAKAPFDVTVIDSAEHPVDD
jgi:uncharacterized protein (TIGR03435 family)